MIEKIERPQHIEKLTTGEIQFLYDVLADRTPKYWDLYWKNDKR